MPEGSSLTGKTGWIERAERGKPINPEPVKPVVEPPEVVSVEMSPEEQDVYALMGISPLVLMDREVKNPRSVIINVTLPGQSPVGTLSHEASIEVPSADEGSGEATELTPSFQQDEGVMLDPTPESFLETPAFTHLPEEDQPFSFGEEIAHSAGDSDEGTLASAELLGSTMTDEREGSHKTPINRRRRRRSSATEGSSSSSLE
jgi:ribonuclease E